MSETRLPDHAGRVIAVVNSTEWRNLCARGSIRLMRHRVTQIRPGSEPYDLARAFTAAPTTKINSSVDVLVLEVRTSWADEARQHPAHPDALILELHDVDAHYVVSEEHLDYYRTEAAKEGVDVAGTDYAGPWAEWTLSEKTRAAIETASMLAAGFADAELSGHFVDSARGERIARIALGADSDDTGEDIITTLTTGALRIDDAAAAVRGTEAYAVACCVEWIELRSGVDVFEVEPLSSLTRSTLEAARHLETRDDSALSPATAAALDLLEAAYPDAFAPELPALALPMLVQMLADARAHLARPHHVRGTLRTLARLSSNPAALACLLAAAVLGPELARQLLRDDAPPLAADDDGRS